MNFQVFKRRVGASPATISVLGTATDPIPLVTTKAAPGKDNVLQAKVGGVGNAIHRVACGYWYEGAGVAVDCAAALWIYDRGSEKWYQAASGTLRSGELTFFRVPYLADPPQTNANLTKPTSGGGEYMLVVASPGGAPDGTYHFVMGADTSQF